MVETTFNENTGLTRIVLKPNNSASWRSNMLILGSLALILFAISSYLAVYGLWLVFPFAGLEILVLYICLYLRVRANHSTEVISIDKTQIVVERGNYHAEKSWEYNRLWTKFLVLKPTFRGHPKRIFIRSHGKELELGSFLNTQDKDLFINDLKHIAFI